MARTKLRSASLIGLFCDLGGLARRSSPALYFSCSEAVERKNRKKEDDLPHEMFCEFWVSKQVQRAAYGGSLPGQALATCLLYAGKYPEATVGPQNITRWKVTRIRPEFTGLEFTAPEFTAPEFTGPEFTGLEFEFAGPELARRCTSRSARIGCYSRQTGISPFRIITACLAFGLTR